MQSALSSIVWEGQSGDAVTGMSSVSICLGDACGNPFKCVRARYITCYFLSHHLSSPSAVTEATMHVRNRNGDLLGVPRRAIILCQLSDTGKGMFSAACLSYYTNCLTHSHVRIINGFMPGSFNSVRKVCLAERKNDWTLKVHLVRWQSFFIEDQETKQAFKFILLRQSHTL